MPAVNSSLIASPLIFTLPTLQQSFLCFKSKTAIRFLLEDLDGLNLTIYTRISTLYVLFSSFSDEITL